MAGFRRPHNKRFNADKAPGEVVSGRRRDHGALRVKRNTLGEIVPAELLSQLLVAVVIGMIAGQHWSAVITYREVGVRLIWVRRSRDEEATLYEG